MALENPQDTDIEIDLDMLGKKSGAHDDVAWGHKHVHGGNVITREQKVITNFFPGRRIVKVRLPRDLKPAF